MLKVYLPFIILIICVISIFLVKFTYVSLTISILTLVLSIIFSRKNLRIMLVTIIISLATIITDGIILSKQSNENDTDIFVGKNILLGTWNYNTDGGTYIFKDDYTYIQYSDSDTSDNYCIGTYKYSYGGNSKDGTVITQDENNYYYDLLLTETSCVNSSISKIDKEEIELVFGINKNDYQDLIFMDIENNNAYKVTKVKD